MSKEQEKKVSKQDLENEKIKAIKEEENKIFHALSDIEYQSLVSDCYTEMDVYTDMVIKGISTGALIEGSGGTGKTFRVINQALKSGVDEMAYADSYSTPQSLFIWLYENRDKKVLVIDDCAGLMSNEKILAFLKGGLWDVNGKRIINYMTTKPLKDSYGELIPSSFELNAGIVIITNFLNTKNPHVQAVLSRINYARVEVPRKELLMILEQIAHQKYGDLSEDERLECFEYLKNYTSDTTANLNIRTLFKMFQFKIYSKQNGNGELWKTLALKMLQKDDRLVIVENLLKDDNFKSEDERVAKFFELTGDSRSTYFRLKKRIEKDNV